MADGPTGHAPFSVWNRSGNQVVILLLRSRLHGLLSGRLLLITVTGRRTGRQHTLPVAYERDGERLRIPVMWPERKLWWRNLNDGAPVRLRLGGEDRTGRGQARTGEDGEVSVEVQLDERT
ncbi:MAG TPA: nitroreductase/quinone reductase family protein [Solirubrobacteraceae bacterium]|nr:nitroreductase/quinone reductase family protein [Solirubrobacteraceae bacterium]